MPVLTELLLVGRLLSPVPEPTVVDTPYNTVAASSDSMPIGGEIDQGRAVESVLTILVGGVILGILVRADQRDLK